MGTYALYSVSTWNCGWMACLEWGRQRAPFNWRRGEENPKDCSGTFTTPSPPHPTLMQPIHENPTDGDYLATGFRFFWGSLIMSWAFVGSFAWKFCRTPFVVFSQRHHFMCGTPASSWAHRWYYGFRAACSRLSAEKSRGLFFILWKNTPSWSRNTGVVGTTISFREIELSTRKEWIEIAVSLNQY